MVSYAFVPLTSERNLTMKSRITAMALAALAVGGAMGDTSDALGLVTLISVNLSP